MGSFFEGVDMWERMPGFEPFKSNAVCVALNYFMFHQNDEEVVTLLCSLVQVSLCCINRSPPRNEYDFCFFNHANVGLNASLALHLLKIY